MLERLRSILRFGGRGGQERAPADLLTLDRDEIAPFLSVGEGLPRLDWSMADVWITRKAAGPGDQDRLKRAVAAAWLDGLRDALEADHKRWRHARIEGLAPVAENCAARVAAVADHAVVTIERALVPIRGDEPIPLAGIVALDGMDPYYSFISYYHAEEGEWGTSGGMYIHEGADSFAVVALPVIPKTDIGKTVAHELTHHALRGLELPLWVEEGFTQMMEERVTGRSYFKLDHEMMRRHRERWGGEEVERFVAGDSFFSPYDDEQELAYNLAQLVVRGWLSREPQRFFAFARACQNVGPQAAAEEHLGKSEAEVVGQALGL